jgi:hypothetical protein
VAAISFCGGYLLGWWRHYQVASLAMGEHKICPPSPPPSNDEVNKQFVAWAHANPKRMDESATHGVYRFVLEKWPCKP